MDEDYYYFLIDHVTYDKPDHYSNYSKLLRHLDAKPFKVVRRGDENRVEDAIALRKMYYGAMVPEWYDDSTCSVLEMMIALAIRCEDTLMWDPDQGDRTERWFWEMIDSLGLSYMTNSRFNKVRCDNVLNRFMSRSYDADGHGGLFTIEGLETEGDDMKNYEIWYQMNMYLSRLNEVNQA